MRRSVKVLANFLGAAKELTGEYAELAEITDDEQNQIRMSLADRPDRKQAVKLLAAKGLSTKDIAEQTGWPQRTIQRDVVEIEAAKAKLEAARRQMSQKTATNVAPAPSAPSKPTMTGSAETKAHREEVAKAAAAEGVTEAPVAEEKYRIFYADPPWDYGAHAQPDYHTEQRDHYPVMPLEAICALPVKEWAEDNAVLFLWVTSPMLEKSFQLVSAWGFEYKSTFVWDKIKHNMGHYNSMRHELLLICTRGACRPDALTLIDSVQSIERREHSEKPVEFYDIIETLYVHGRKLEIFARQQRDGWNAYGHIAEIAEPNLAAE